MKKIKIQSLVIFLKKLGGASWSNFIFIVILFLYVLRDFFKLLIKIRFVGKIFKLIRLDLLAIACDNFMKFLDGNVKNKMSRIYLIELSFRNMRAKKNRSFVTIGGVAVGVGAIVFLVSIGYGLEKMVISKVARLDELRMADITGADSLSLKMDDEIIEKIYSFDGVEDVIPLVSMVSKIKYNNSVLDVRSFGVDSRYIKAVSPKFIHGGNFEDKDLDFTFDNSGEVQGISQEVVFVEYGEKVDEHIYNYNVNPNDRLMVYEKAELGAEVIGYVVRNEGGYVGEEIWGDKYYDDPELLAKNLFNEDQYSKWIKTKVPLWDVGEDGRAIPQLSAGGIQKWMVGYIRKDKIKIDYEDSFILEFKSLEDYLYGEVLGITDEASDSATTLELDESMSEDEVFDEESEEETEEATTSAFGTEVFTDESGVEWIELMKAGDDPNTVQEVEFLGLPSGEAYVTTGMLKLFGVASDKAIGEKFMVSYIIIDSMIPDKTGRLQSKEVEYVIKGVVEDDNSSFYYYNLADAKRLGIKNYSQIKIVAKNTNSLSEVRNAVQTLGFKTSSTVDTVTEIEKIFKTLRLILGFLGTIALAVASLGMFNTMTVSLLERTREVGVMKAIGMLPNEVRELFMAESMIMGLGGGIFGILFGYGLGQLSSLFLSSISLSKGQGFMSITYIPWFFIGFILLISFIVGVVTGWYPSVRARKISALNALRYE
jgi:ABC-type antimicrobial peptide transport system permease subunit